MKVNINEKDVMIFSCYGGYRTFTKQERYEWSRRYVFVNFFRIIDVHTLRKIAKIQHDDGKVYTIPFESYIIKHTILGYKLLIQRVWLYNLGVENDRRKIGIPERITRKVC